MGIVVVSLWMFAIAGSMKATIGESLSWCCSNGNRYFEETNTCTSIILSSTRTCKRTASICCLRTLIDNRCSEGAKIARQQRTCSFQVNKPVGDVLQECCHCCLLARELSDNGQLCQPPADLGLSCRKAFNECCLRESKLNEITDANLEFDRCSEQHHCEQQCTDRGDVNIECSCFNGYQLSSNDLSCTDTNECLFAFACSSPHEQCMNTIGSYTCVCQLGFYWSNPSQTCVDVDECALLADDCKETQRCINIIGSYKCIRTRSCGTGYVLVSDTDECADVNECLLGTHDCGKMYHCRNTKGSYRCDRKKCPQGRILDRSTGRCKSIDCPVGFRLIDQGSRCEDVNECDQSSRCQPFVEECVNTPGSYRCQKRGNFCASGYKIGLSSGICIDIDECADAVHSCPSSSRCINTDGSYRCHCQRGFHFDQLSRQCLDVDECDMPSGRVCSLDATCENTVGSFRCHCRSGFQLAGDQRSCHDVDECSLGVEKCEQKCVNTPGSYQCVCNRGFTLSVDGFSCQDIDECAIWTGFDAVCTNGCINTRGSYRCQCADGYLIQADDTTCKDIDECDQGECQGSDRICLNTLGAFKCHVIECPPNYDHDSSAKNTVDDGYSCVKTCHPNDHNCIGNHTREIIYQFAAIPSMKFAQRPIEVTRIRVEMNALEFSVNYRLNDGNVGNFRVEQDGNTGIVKLIAPIKGPMTKIVRLDMNTKSRTGVLVAHNVALIHVHISAYYQ